ncbi:MAG: hypothetical protein SFY80_08745 [Verrucomicrobiota bacterium]|nr:hypothetical protein [Verrucomicrobiota bacterium]
MKTIHRNPQVEEGRHNIVLQNRCGNRVTLLCHEDRAEFEFVYKPNAFRRKDFRARNFSCRDNQTELFASFQLPDLCASHIRKFDYDPFVTRLHTETPSLAQNAITVVNVIDENCFAIAADRPLTIAIKPRGAFVCTDGLLTESFVDRGEDIVSFIAFASYEANRFRVIADGTHVLQIYENEIIWVGGEDSIGRVHATLEKLRPHSLDTLIAYNERQIEPVMRKGRTRFNDEDFQRVIDFNKRIIYSGMDAGGACFGALNRIYYLIWNRDGSQTASMTARAGNLELIKLWAPFILANPAIRRDAKGQKMAEWLQMLGTRWTKAEDDGIYYAFISLFALYQTTADDSLLHTPDFERLLGALDLTIATRFDEKEQLFGSDVRGEDDLHGSPNFGYDTVNGTISPTVHRKNLGHRRAYGLYHNVNLYNTLRMAAALIAVVPEVDSGHRERYAKLASRLANTLSTRFVNAVGIFRSEYTVLTDGTSYYTEFTDSDYWEYCWAVSVGPFFPDINVALRSARHVRENWPKIKAYGYCPWNTLSRFLKEWGTLDSVAYRDMLADEVREARLQSVKYPMKDALTEYYGETEGWRPLPFSAGSFLWSTSSLLLQSMPCGLAVRASTWVDAVDDYCFKQSHLFASATGQGDTVQSWLINGEVIQDTLQIPENLLRTGHNRIVVTRGQIPGTPRLYSSDARLLRVQRSAGTISYHFESSGHADLVFENWSQVKQVSVEPVAANRVATPADNRIQVSAVEGTELTLLRVALDGEFILRVNAG